jgi:hypothetical protein
MAAFNKFNLTVQDWIEGKTNYNADTFKVMLTNTAPVATNHVYSDISANELAAGNGYSTGGATATVGLSNSGGTETVTISLANPTWTSSTGSMGPFRYLVLYDSSAGTQTLQGYWDYGSSVTLNGANGDTFTGLPGANLFTLT